MHRVPERGRRRLIRLLARAGVAAGALVAGAAHADEGYPAKPVKLVTNLPPGGPLDALGRALAVPLQSELKQLVLVDNRPGAGGNVGADAVAKSAPDGYTLLLSIDAPFTINPHLYPTMPFAAKDLKPVMIFSVSGLVFGTGPAITARTLPELILRSRTQKVTFGSAGNGSPGHLAAEIFASTTGSKVTHVPYKGNAPALTALLAGEVQAGILATPGLLPQIHAGRLKALAVTGRQRSPLLPEVPTVVDFGLPGLELEVLYLAMVPTATPAPIVEALRKALQAALATPDVQTRLAALDMVALGETGPAAASRLETARVRYGGIVKATGMKAE